MYNTIFITKNFQSHIQIQPWWLLLFLISWNSFQLGFSKVLENDSKGSTLVTRNASQLNLVAINYNRVYVPPRLQGLVGPNKSKCNTSGGLKVEIWFRNEASLLSFLFDMYHISCLFFKCNVGYANKKVMVRKLVCQFHVGMSKPSMP